MMWQGVLIWSLKCRTQNSLAMKEEMSYSTNMTPKFLKYEMNLKYGPSINRNKICICQKWRYQN